MSKVYILPEIIIWDKKITTYCHPNVFAKKQKEMVNWTNAHDFRHYSRQEYILYIDGVEIPRKDNRMMSPLSESYYYYGKVNNWGLFSFDIEPGEHTIRIEAYQESFYKEEDLFPFTKNGERCQRIHIVNSNGSIIPYKQYKYKFKDEIKFYVGAGNNVYFRFYLEYEQYYPLCHEKRYFYTGNLNCCQYNDINCWFHYNYLKYAINHKVDFAQINYATLKQYMDKRFQEYSAIVYNEQMPEPTADDINGGHIVKSTTGNSNTNSNSTPKQTKTTDTKQDGPALTSNTSRATAVTKVTSSVSSKPMSISEQAKAAGKTIAEFIMDKPEPVKPKKRIVKKEVTKYIKYYDTEDFKELMEGFDYKVEDGEVVVEKVNKSSKELIVPDGVTVIKTGAFSELDGVTFVKLPYSVKVVEKGAFKNNKSIQKVEFLSKVSVIEEETFYGCSSLKEIGISPYTKRIKTNAFLGTSIKKVYLPYGIKIVEDAFDKSVTIVYGTQRQIDVEKQVYDAIVAEALIDKNNKDKISELKKQFEIELSQMEKDFNETKEQLSQASGCKKQSTSEFKANELEIEIQELKDKIRKIKEKL